MTEERESNRTIVLLHGFASHRAWMWRLERCFRRAGHRTLNWGYNSWFRPIEHHASQLSELIQQLDQDQGVSKIDFVTHSMGCIVARSALLNGLPEKCGRWVMLAPPNRGSHVANHFSPIVGKWIRPVRQLQAKKDSYVNQLAVPGDIDIAVIQAALDYIVRESSTRIREEKDRFVVPGLHSAMLLRRDVAKQSLHFLEHGRFNTSPDADD